MNPVKLLNPVTNDVWYCENINLTKEIDGVQYIYVYRHNPKQSHLMRKDALKRANTR